MAADSRRRSFVGLTISNLTRQPWSQVVGAYLTLLVASRTTSAIAISFALSAHRGIAAVLMPVMGRLSDRASTRAGRRVPLMVVGTAVGGVTVMLMTLTSGYWPLLIAIVVTRVSLQIASIGSVGVTPDVFGRSRWAKAVGAIAAIGFLPGLLTLGLIRQTWKQDDPSTWDITFLVAGAGLLIGALAVALLVREAPATEEVAAIAAKGSWRDELARIRAVPNGVHLIASIALLAVSFAGINRLLPVWARDELGVGGAEFASVSLIVGAVTAVLVPFGLFLGSRAHPRLLSIVAAVVGSVVTALMTVITEPAMFVVLTGISIPLTVAAFASLAPQLIPLFPKGDRLGQAFGMVVGPFGLVTSLAGLASATVVDIVGTTDALWVVSSVLLLVLAVNMATLHVPAGARTDVRGLLRKARDAGLGPGLFDGSVDLEDVLGIGAIPPAVRTRIEIDLMAEETAAGVPVRVVGDVVVPPLGTIRDTVFLCWPGGGMDRRYWDLDDEFSMAAYLADAGFLSVIVDHLGVGESTRIDDGALYTSELVADVDAAAAKRILCGLREGSLVPDVRAMPLARLIGVGHSMGALFAVWQQARHRPYDGLVLLGFGVDGVQLETALAHAEEARARRASFASDGDMAAGGTATSDLLLAGMEVPEGVFSALRRTSSSMVPTDGIERLRRGAPELAVIDVPVLIANGDRDITGDAERLLDAFPGTADRSLFVLGGSGHNHNVAPNRRELWDHIASWATARFP